MPDEWIEFLKDQMQLVVPNSLKRGALIKPDVRQDFFEIVCAKACLNPESNEVRKAFEELYPLQMPDDA